MAIVTAICTCSVCNKTFDLRVKKPNRAGANSFEEWAVRNIAICRACEQAAAHKAACDRAVSMGLPPLSGSEKQIKWAVDIRDDFVVDIAKVTAAAKPSNADIIHRQCNLIMQTRTSAAWWISMYMSSARHINAKSVYSYICSSKDAKDKALAVKLHAMLKHRYQEV